MISKETNLEPRIEGIRSEYEGANITESISYLND